MSIKTWKPKLPKNHTNHTTNYAILPDDEKKEEKFIGQPLEHEPYLGEYKWATRIKKIKSKSGEVIKVEVSLVG